ncbi:hypothetical protein PAXRUDRAFT_28705 [Paxillus rubicundulus Ve08.2h10]|uniref:Uncharacterized protein n=1 Tax=Paxillus rubicundulus Ve08.2h10 TaxID=930991 RepID=A0A0D0DBK8_9AGAM|nr:hypothetical protein PAXRUDRAFT_28705 [Paxillus rubicundulus Ve08.2h10]
MPPSQKALPDASYPHSDDPIGGPSTSSDFLDGFTEHDGIFYDDGGNLVEFAAGETDQFAEGNSPLKSLDEYGIYGAYEDGLAMLRGLAIHEELEEPDNDTGIPEHTYTEDLDSDSDLEDDKTNDHDPRSPWFPYGSKVDWANPQTRRYIETYPVESKNISESFQAAKIRELDHKLCDPMWADGNKHYYIGELAELKGGQLVIPVRWFQLERNGPVHAEGVFVMHDPMPWGDDVSGNRSKQYNEHHNIYFKNSNIGHEKLAQEYFVRFCSTSPHATAGEQFDAMLADSVNSLNFVRMSDSKAIIGAASPGKPRDPTETLRSIQLQITEAALSIQETVTALQRKSGVKDKLAEFWIQQLIEKAHALQREHIQVPVTRDQRLNHIRPKERAALVKEIERSIQTELLQWLYRQPPKSYASLPEHSRHCAHNFALVNHFNSLLTAPALNAHQDSPVKILHTYLLGNDKYDWHLLNSPWMPAQSYLFTVRLQASSIDGLTIPPLRVAYILQYKNGLIGKHFKALQQLAFFHLDDSLCLPLIQELFRAIGELGAILWYHEINDMDTYFIHKSNGNLDGKQGSANTSCHSSSAVDPQQSVLQTTLHIQIPQSGVALGSILKILRSVEDATQNLVILEKFVVSNGRHSHFGMPEVLKSLPLLTLAIQSTKMLPRHLTASVPFITNCRDRHDTLAAALRETQDVKRARDKANREAHKTTHSSKVQPNGSHAAPNQPLSGGQL